MLGIFIGIATIVALISLGQGLKTAVMDQFSFLSPDIVSVSIGEGTDVLVETVNPLSDDELEALQKTSGIESVAPRNMRAVNYIYGDYSESAMAMSVPEGEYKELIYDIISVELADGRLLKDVDKYKVLIGNNIANKDSFEKPLRVGDKILIEKKHFEIVGILKKKGSFMMDNIIAMNQDVMVDILNLENGVYDVLAARVKKNYPIEKAIDNAERNIRKVRNVKEEDQNFAVEAALDKLEQVESTLFAVQLFIYIIASVSILVGGIGIMNTMYTSVLERTKEIGIMKAIGARNSTIFVLFFIESGLLGLVGGLIGIMLGSGLGLAVSHIATMTLGTNLVKSHITIPLLGGSLLFSFLLGSLSGLLPAYGAAKLHPVEALQKTK